MALPIDQEFASKDMGPDVGTFEAAYDLAMMDTFVSNMARSGIETLGIDGSLDQLESTPSRTLSVEELNQKYPNVETPFTHPTKEAVALHLDDEGKKRRLLQEKISLSSDSSTYKTVASLGAGLVAHALDPVEFAAGALPGMAASKIGALAAVSASPKIAKAGAFLANQGTAYNVAEGIAGNAALEPFMYSAAKEAQVDYTVQDAIVSIVAGGSAAPLTMYGVKKAFHKISQSNFGQSIKTSIGQLNDGKVPDVSLFEKMHEDLTFSQPKIGSALGDVRAKYSFEKLDVDTLKTREMFAVPKLADSFDEGTRISGDYMGEGYYITDNPNIANNMAAHAMEEMPSNIHSVDIKDLNLIDADIPNREILDSLELPKKLQTLIKKADSISQAQAMLREKIETGKLKDVDFEKFMGAIKAKGIDGLKSTLEDKGHNSVFVFKDSTPKVKMGDKFDADVDSTPVIKDQLIAKHMDENPVKNFQEDVELKSEFDNFKEIEDIPIEEKQLFVDDSLKVFDDMEKLELLDEEDMAVLASIKEGRKDTNDFISAIDEYANCLLSGAD